jgi:transcriptional regulator with PAS, ATPase and Fis domain
LNVVFPPDPELDQATSEDDKSVSKFDSNNKEPGAAIDLLLETAVKRHVRFAYEQANQNQRRAAKLLGISRSTLARILQDVAPT